MILLIRNVSRLAWGVFAVAVAAATSLVAPPAQAQRDRLVSDIMRMADDKDPEDGFCKRVPWRVAGNRAQEQFLDRAVVGTDEAAKFSDGACSYTRVTQIYSNRYGKCVRYTWWACGPGQTCNTGKTSWCKNRDGRWTVQD